MKRLVFLLAIVSLVAVSSTTMPQESQDPVVRAVHALGGLDTLRGVKTVSMKGTVKQWEPEQSMAPGGEMRFANEATFDSVTDASSGFTRVDWVRKFAYPTARTFTFTEIVTSEVGYVAGIDSNGRTKQSLDSNPPAHNMSGLRLAVSQRELRRNSALLLLDMYRNPAHDYNVPNVTVGGVAYPTVEYRVGDAPIPRTPGAPGSGVAQWCQGVYLPAPGTNFSSACPPLPATVPLYESLWVMFDATTGLPARIRSFDYDNIWGDVTYDLVLSDWQTFDGVKVATTRKYELNGRVVAEIKLTEVKFNAPVPAERFGIPTAYITGAPKPATGALPYQWVIRRQFIGTYMDSDSPSYDTRASTGLRFNELAPGVQHAVGGTHHSLVVEMRDHLIVFDAPVSDAQSNWVLNAARAKYPGKPVKYLVLTHHHMDHAGGLRAYVAEGATLVVGRGASEHFRRVLAAPYTRNPDLTGRDLSRTEIIEVVDKRVFSDGSRQVEAYLIENPHAASMLIGYIPEARLGYVTDIWSPGAAPLPASLSLVPNTAALVAGVKKAGISPLKFAGGHGSTFDYAPLAGLEGK
jgi:glyoxylase-like metal-dependent hydrolase (beta-lactamase superfamily II)